MVSYIHKEKTYVRVQAMPWILISVEHEANIVKLTVYLPIYCEQVYIYILMYGSISFSTLLSYYNK